MRLALMADTKSLVHLYNEAATYAGTVGHIDWENPFPAQLIEKFIEEHELFCIDGENDLPSASVRLTHFGDSRIWQTSKVDSYLYVSKLATANSVRGTGYTANVLLPTVAERASGAVCSGMRLDCLADNPRLIRFYQTLGFMSLGTITFYSDKQKKPLSVNKFELTV